MVSLWCELLRELSIYTLKSDQGITIWWAKFKLDCLLLIVIYSNQKFKSLAKGRTLNTGTSELNTEETTSKIFTLHSSFFFLIKNVTKLPSCVLWSLLLSMKPSDAHQNGSLQCYNTKNTKSRVRKSQVCYLRVTHWSALESFHTFL